MSNEYKDYLLDCAQEYLIDNNYLNYIESVSVWDDGFLIVGNKKFSHRLAYFVWLDPLTGWRHKKIDIND